MAQGRYYSVPAKPEKAITANGTTMKPCNLMPVEDWLKAMETAVIEQKKQFEILT